MAAFTKFECFTEDVLEGVHQFSTHVFKWYLTNVAPSVSLDLVKADLAEMAAGNGYTAGGATDTITVSRSGGTTTVDGSGVSWTASGGAMDTFRYAVLYNDTSASDSLIGYYDYAASRTPASGEGTAIVHDITNGIFRLT